MQTYTSFNKLLEADEQAFNEAIICFLFRVQHKYLADKYIKTTHINLCVGDLFSLTESTQDKAVNTLTDFYPLIRKNIAETLALTSIIDSIAQTTRILETKEEILKEFVSQTISCIWVKSIHKILDDVDFGLRQRNTRIRKIK